MMQWYKSMPFIQFQRFVSELQDIGGDKNCFAQATLLGDGAVSTTLGEATINAMRCKTGWFFVAIMHSARSNHYKFHPGPASSKCVMCTSYPYLPETTLYKAMLASSGGRLAECIMYNCSLGVAGPRNCFKLCWVESCQCHDILKSLGRIVDEKRVRMAVGLRHRSLRNPRCGSAAPKNLHIQRLKVFVIPKNNFIADETLGNQVMKVLKRRGHCSCIFLLRLMMLTIAHRAFI